MMLTIISTMFFIAKNVCDITPMEIQAMAKLPKISAITFF